MIKEEKLRNKYLYKIFLIFLKIIPFLLAFISVLNTVLSYFAIDLVVLSYIGSVSLIPLIFMYLAAFVFKFCIYHRIFLDYTVVSNCLAVYDYYIGIPISATGAITIQLCLFFITLVIALWFHLKEKRDVKIVKQRIKKNC